MESKIAVIIVNWNGKNDTLECLENLKQCTYPHLGIVVVDNASSDDSCSLIHEQFPDVVVLQSEQNVGFCGGNNLGIRQALKSGCDYVFLVNNDTTMEPDCLEKLLACARNTPEAAIVCPTIYHYHDRTRAWFTGSIIDMERGYCAHTVTDVRHLDSSAPVELPWATGCAMLIPRPVMQQLHGFDERFFCYYEDVDLSLRAIASGYKVLLCPGAMLYHKVAASAGHDSPLVNYYMTRNGLLIFTRYNRGKRRLYVALRLTRRALQSALAHSKIKGVESKCKARALLNGMSDFYRRRFFKARHSW